MSITVEPATKRTLRRAIKVMPGPLAGDGIAAPPKLRRRPFLVAASVFAICMGALLAVWAYSSTSDAREVVGVRGTVQRGEVIGREDLVLVRISVDPALHPIPASQIDSVVGARAALDVAAGGLLTQEVLAPSVVPAKGMSVVGISLEPSMMPATELQVGDQVRVVATPGAQGEVATGAAVFIDATVAGVRGGAEIGQSVVDVTLPYADAAQWAARAATGKVALVLDSRER